MALFQSRILRDSTSVEYSFSERFEIFLFLLLLRETILISTEAISIIVNYDRIYGSIGLYIPVGIDLRDNIFRYFLPRPT